jgi:undecaprenyl pyrophosphate phosphatase UppP
MPDGLPPEDQAGLGAAGVAAGLGCSIVATVIFFIVAGVFLDRELDKRPIFTLAGVAIALIAAGYQLVEMANVGRADKKPGPVIRGIRRLPVAHLGHRNSGIDRGRTENEE